VTDERSPATIPAAFAAAVAADPTRPLLTFYDDATGDRTELSGATLANWVAKTANLLVDGCGLSPGDVVAVRLPAHWQTAAALLGAWAAGLSVDFGGTPQSATVSAAADSAQGHSAATSGGPPAEVAFVAADRVAEAPVSASDVFALGLAPMAMPMRPGPPPGTVDYVAEVRGHGDRFAPHSPTRPTDVAVFANGTTATHGDVLAAARATFALNPGDRVLVNADALPDPRDWLLAPLVSGATIVLTCHTSPDEAVTTRRMTAERVTHRLPSPA
jgi:uncharacterized protein (TIGR03089 family)